MICSLMSCRPPIITKQDMTCDCISPLDQNKPAPCRSCCFWSLVFSSFVSSSCKVQSSYTNLFAIINSHTTNIIMIMVHRANCTHRGRCALTIDSRCHDAQKRRLFSSSLTSSLFAHAKICTQTGTVAFLRPRATRT